nr:M56 family metallopeptidase [Conexibacter sp. DBS9H8]
MSFSVPSAARAFAACRSWLTTLDPVGLLAMAIGAIGMMVIVRTLSSALRLQRSTSRYLRSLQPVETLPGYPPVEVVADAAPQAFCAGLLQPRIYISTGALERLNRDELRSVLAHETHHTCVRDPFRLLVTRALGDGLFFVPAMRRMNRDYAMVSELAADEAAVRAGGGPQPLASAMLTFGEAGDPAVVGVSTERVDHLLGGSPPLLPLRLQVAGGLTIGVLMLAVLLVAHATATAHISLMLLLMQSCGPFMLAFPALLVVAAARAWVSR